MDKFTEIEIIDGIRRHEEKILNYLYKRFFKEINFFILKNNGKEADAKDIFQEALIIIYRKAKHEDLVLTCSFSTYIYSVCRLLWLKQLKQRNVAVGDISEMGDRIEMDDETQSVFEDNERYALYQKHYSKLAEDCKKILKLFLENNSLKKIAEIMGYKSEQYAKKRKFMCKGYLVKSIQKDPKYKELV